MSDNTLKIWNWSSNAILFNLNWAPLTQPYNYVITRTNLKFLANGLLAAPSSGNTLSIWDTATGQVKFAINGAVSSLEQLSNSNLATTGNDKMLKIWSSTTGKLLYQTGTDNYMHFALKQTLVPNYLASACQDNKIYIWDINTLRQVATLIGHTDQVYLLELMPNGLLISGSIDYTVKLWNISSSSTSPLSSISFSAQMSCMKPVSNNQFVVGFQANYIQFINISSSNNTMTMTSQVNLNTEVYDMRLTSGNVLALCQKDGSVVFMNTNTQAFVQTSTPAGSSIAPWSLDLIGNVIFSTRLVFFLPF
jgi:WD40 repeat protein